MRHRITVALGDDDGTRVIKLRSHLGKSPNGKRNRRIIGMLDVEAARAHADAVHDLCDVIEREQREREAES